MAAAIRHATLHQLPHTHLGGGVGVGVEVDSAREHDVTGARCLTGPGDWCHLTARIVLYPKSKQIGVRVRLLNRLPIRVPPVIVRCEISSSLQFYGGAEPSLIRAPSLGAGECVEVHVPPLSLRAFAASTVMLIATPESLDHSSDTALSDTAAGAGRGAGGMGADEDGMHGDAEADRDGTLGDHDHEHDPDRDHNHDQDGSGENPHNGKPASGRGAWGTASRGRSKPKSFLAPFDTLVMGGPLHCLPYSLPPHTFLKAEALPAAEFMEAWTRGVAAMCTYELRFRCSLSAHHIVHSVNPRLMHRVTDFGTALSPHDTSTSHALPDFALAGYSAETWFSEFVGVVLTLTLCRGGGDASSPHDASALTLADDPLSRADHLATSHFPDRPRSTGQYIGRMQVRATTPAVLAALISNPESFLRRALFPDSTFPEVFHTTSDRISSYSRAPPTTSALFTPSSVDAGQAYILASPQAPLVIDLDKTPQTGTPMNHLGQQEDAATVDIPTTWQGIGQILDDLLGSMSR